MRRLTVLASLLVVFAASILFQSRRASQTPKAPPKRPPEELLRRSLAAEGPGLAQPFKGLTANGTIEPGVFTIRSTGVSTKPVKLAAEKFLAGLSDAARREGKDERKNPPRVRERKTVGPATSCLGTQLLFHVGPMQRTDPAQSPACHNDC